MSWLTSHIECWPLNEASGNALGVNGNNLTDRNTVGSAAGKVHGNSRDFVRANSESFDIADNAALSMGDIAFAFTIWVMLDSNAATQVFVCKGNDVTTTNLEYALYFSTTSGGRFNFRVCGGVTNAIVTANNFGTPSTGVWYFIHCYHDPSANVIGISVNNGTANTAAHSAGVNDGGNAFYLGWDVNSARYSDAKKNELNLWKRLLTASEVTQSYNDGRGLRYPFAIKPQLVDSGLITQHGLIDGGLVAA
jgi:hypothetical protein